MLCSSEKLFLTISSTLKASIEQKGVTQPANDPQATCLSQTRTQSLFLLNTLKLLLNSIKCQLFYPFKVIETFPSIEKLT